MEISPLHHNAPPFPRCIALPREADVYALLEELGVEYDCVATEPADTMEKCSAIAEALGTPVCKNLFLCNRQKTKFYLLAMAPDKPFRTKDLSRQINSARLSFAPEEELHRLLGCFPGSASVLGVMHDTEQQVQLLMDRETYEAPFFGCHPCNCTTTLKLKSADLLEKILPRTGHAVTVVDLPWDTE